MSVTQLLAIKRSDHGNASHTGTDNAPSRPLIDRIFRRNWPWSRASSSDLDPRSSSSSAVLAVLLHEIRNPLGTLANAAHVLASTPPSNDVALARTVRSEVRRLQKLTDTLGLICTGPRPTHARFDLSGSISDLLLLVKHEPGFEQGRRLIAQISDEPLTVRGDADQIQQVLWNLLLNACHHGYGPVWLEIDSSRRYVHIKVRNRYSQERPDRMDANAGDKRMGLGLDISRFILQRHGSQLYMSRSNGRCECSFALRRVRNH
ncbi:MAG: HAMP domain-containing sensor histidine kinase [Acidihalobacter sp.]